MSVEFANQVYTILVSFGGAREDDRDSFIYHHCEDKHKDLCTEWRFQGHFGFGGKYRSTWNGVTAYSEDITPQMQIKLGAINQKLKELKK